MLFFIANQATNFKSSPTDFSSGFSIAGNVETKNTEDAASLIKNVRLTFASNTYPQESYDLETDQTSTNGKGRVYTDYTIASDALRTPCGALMDFSQWTQNQVYVMKLKHELNNISGAVSVLIDLVRKPVDMSTSCLVMGLGDEFFTMKFDDLSQSIYGALSSTPPIEI